MQLSLLFLEINKKTVLEAIMNDFDLVVIGGGSAGYAAAARAAGQGKRVALIEADKLGGECPNRACVPTKALLRSAEILRTVRESQRFGVFAKDVSFDWDKVMERKNRIVDQLTGERLHKMLDRWGVSLYTGRAIFESNLAIEVDNKKISAAKSIIDTGSKPLIPKIKGLTEAHYLTSNEAVDLEELPRSIAIIGGGAVGVEFAQIFSSFDVKTTLIEAGDQLLPNEDFEISELVKTYLGEAGVEVIVGAKVESVALDGGQKKVEMRDSLGQRSISVDEIMVAAGRSAAAEGLGLESAGVEYDLCGIKVDDSLLTSAGNIWACGDVTGKLNYTHVATYQGDLAGYNAFVEKPDLEDLAVVPRITFCNPEGASVGLTESQAREAGFRILVGRMPYRYLGKSLVIGESRGLIKIIVDGANQEILGGHIVGVYASELIHEIAVAMKSGITAESLTEIIHAYPTIAEGIGVAAGSIIADDTNEQVA